MASDEAPQKAFQFFGQHLHSGVPFTLNEVNAATGWSGQTFETYRKKQYRSFIKKLYDGTYRVTNAFRRYSDWERFKSLITQVRPAAADYEEQTYDIVRVYEFFMPLSNESLLRDTLDTLFYRDTVEERLGAIGFPSLELRIPRNLAEEDDEYIARLCSWVDPRFGGYSVYHVNGRFRAAPLATRAAVGLASNRYLVDETTAVTRFIFHCDDEAEAALVEFFFTELFVQAILEVVSGEDEIWMVETGYHEQLHTWRVQT